MSLIVGFLVNCFSFLFFSSFTCVFSAAWRGHAPASMTRSEDSLGQSVLSSTRRVLGIELRLLGLAASAFTYRSVSPHPNEWFIFLKNVFPLN